MLYVLDSFENEALNASGTKTLRRTAYQTPKGISVSIRQSRIGFDMFEAT